MSQVAPSVSSKRSLQLHFHGPCPFWQGIDPVFCDIDPITWNIDAAQCEALITDRTTVVVGVHLWGRPCDTERLEEIAAHHSLRLVFDAAHAFGCSHRQVMIGRFGDVAQSGGK